MLASPWAGGRLRSRGPELHLPQQLHGRGSARSIRSRDRRPALAGGAHHRCLVHLERADPAWHGAGERLSQGPACRRAGCRRARTLAAAEGARDVGDLMRALRDHGDADEPRYSLLNGAMAAPCMHAGGLVAASQTTASWVAELRPGSVRHWVTGTAAPCTGLFKPVRVDEPLDPGATPTDCADPHSLWWRHERLHRRVMRDPTRLRPLMSVERDALEAHWRAEPPEPSTAFAEGDRLLEAWTDRVADAAGPDTRPRYVRRYWRIRDRRAGLPCA